VTDLSGWLINVVPFLFSLMVAYSGAVGVGLCLRTRSRLAWFVATCGSPLILLCPLLISPEHVILRAFAAVFATEAWFKLSDYRRHLSDDPRTDFHGFLRFLIPFPILLVVYSDKQRRLADTPLRRREAFRICSGTAAFAACFILIDLVAGIAAIQASFALDHAVKLGLFVLAIESLSQALFGLERLAGYEAPPIIRFSFLSRTPAEFWSRYNTRVHAWLWENVFRPSGGRRAPVRGVLLVFFASAVLHEFMFGIATSRFDGYQFTFFMLQAPAVLVSSKLERLARRWRIVGAVIAHGMTIGWFAVTSIFFFHGMNRVFPFVYASRPWLP
jgi:hypothetical protein